ncbi:MAG: hypothetical protein ACXITV_09095 [Luteibaculaceae bacterium]
MGVQLIFKTVKSQLILLAVVFGFATHQGLSQEITPLYTIKGKFDLFYTDNLSNTYAIAGNQVVRFDNNGKELFRTSYLNLGAVFSADFTYTLKPIIFHRDFLSIATLDNTLSMQGRPFNLIDANLQNAMLICSSFDNHFWVYNQDNFEFLRLNYQGQRISRTGSMQQILGREIEPVYMIERNNFLYATDPRVGILVFDIFGTYYKTIGERDVEHFQVFDNVIFFERDGVLNEFHLITLGLTKHELPHNKFKQVRVEKNRIFLLTEESIEVYRWSIFK